MHQTILSAKKIDSRIVQKLNDTKENSMINLFLFDKVKTVNQKNTTCVIIRDAIRNRKKSFDEMLLKKFESTKDTFFFKKKLWISKSDQLKLNIIRKIHDQSTSKHSDICRTCNYINRWYYWFTVKRSIKRYLKNCHICKRFKASRNKYSNLLNSLSISQRSWTNIIMNFVIELFLSNNFNAILMIVNRLTKIHHYISCTATDEDTNVEEIARLLISYVWKLHELSNTIVSDRESQFVSLIWKTICQTLKINVKLSTTVHSKIDDQNEIANQKMKRYLRNYCNYQQNDWFEWLSMIEFVFNAAISASTKLFVFMINYEYESRMSFDFVKTEKTIKERIQKEKTSNIMKRMKDIWEFTKEKLANAQETQKKHANRKKSSSFEYKFNDMMWLFIKNIKIERLCKKLNHKWIGSYKIKRILKKACQLNLFSSMKIHDTFHTFLLRSAAIDSFIEQIQSSSFSIMIEEEEKYEIDDILNSRYHYEKLQYRIIWTSHFSNRAWYSAKNFDNLEEILNDYHQRYSDKSKSQLRLIALIASMTDHFYWLQQAKNLVKDILNKMQTKMKRDDRKKYNKDSFVINVLTRKELWISAD
jgi:hypothetical protein